MKLHHYVTGLWPALAFSLISTAQAAKLERFDEAHCNPNPGRNRWLSATSFSDTPGEFHSADDKNFDFKEFTFNPKFPKKGLVQHTSEGDGTLRIDCKNQFLITSETAADSTGYVLFDLMTGDKLENLGDSYEISPNHNIYEFPESGGCEFGGCSEGVTSEWPVHFFFYSSENRSKGAPLKKIGELKKSYRLTAPQSTEEWHEGIPKGKWTDNSTFTIPLPEQVALTARKKNRKTKIVCRVQKHLVCGEE